VWVHLHPLSTVYSFTPCWNAPKPRGCRYPNRALGICGFGYLRFRACFDKPYQEIRGNWEGDEINIPSIHSNLYGQGFIKQDLGRLTIEAVGMLLLSWVVEDGQRKGWFRTIYSK
jgi:hypothetical protein